eukprot:20310-Eustigmatos_ZCMA.PRE.1
MAPSRKWPSRERSQDHEGMARVDSPVPPGQQAQVEGGAAHVCTNMEHDVATHTQGQPHGGGTEGTQ